MSSFNLSPRAVTDRRFDGFLQSIKFWNIFSQSCEDAIIEAIFDRIGTSNRFCFECGAADGLFFSNTRHLVDQGWDALWIEPDEEDFTKLRSANLPNVRLHQGFVVADPRGEHEMTLDDVLEKYGAPKDLDLLSLDIDSSEYYVFNSMIRFSPRVVIVEYSPTAAPMYIPELRGPGQAGQMAIRHVAVARGYEVIGRTLTNLICVRRELAPLLM